MSYINPETVEIIKSAGILSEIIERYEKLKKSSGGNYTGNCPQCTAQGKLSVNDRKQIWKCFVCDRKGTDAISFLTIMQNRSYPDALREIAEIYNIPIPENSIVQPAKGKFKKKQVQESKIKFRDLQLLESGITQKDQEYYIDHGNKAVGGDRYQSASIDSNFNIIPGDDMVLHYLDLDGKTLTYFDKKGKQRPLIRIRWQNPALHLDKDGKSIKYQTPPDAGSPLWLPQWLINSFAKSSEIQTLYITEGEKKADALCINNMPAVAITGIHNFANTGDMPRQLEIIIQRCKVKRVCFILDSDWQELKISNGDEIAHRPNLFFKAVLKFQKYFQAFALNGIELKIFFAYGKDITLKGADDILTRGLEKNKPLFEDLDKAFIDRDGKGQYMNVVDITSLSDYKIKEIWKLESPQRFRDHHKPELLKLYEFRHNGLKYKVIEGQIELDQKILPHEQFWIEEIIDTPRGLKTKYHYHPIQINTFLRNRGYGIYRVDDRDTVRYIQQTGKIFQEVKALDIKKFVMNFTEEIGKQDVLMMLMNGSRNFFASDKLEHMYEFKPDFLQPDKDIFYFIFLDQFWKITANSITTHKIEELPGYIWDKRVIKFKPKLLKPLIQVGREGENWVLEYSKDYLDSDIVKFFLNTSNFSWRTQFKEVDTEDGIVYIQNNHKLTAEEISYNETHLVCKMLATGYILHDYKNHAQMKAVLAVDSKETEVGRSEGGTGKSIWSCMFEHLIPTEIIDGKRPNLQNDPHIYENVDERTQLIVFDDCRQNLDFEHFLSQITRGITVNPKGLKRFKVPGTKFIFSTNHAVNGDGNSFERRQYYISFGDYYNRYRTPADDLGRQMFREWDNIQWNYFYNYMACCLQTYLRFPDLNTYTIPTGDVKRRQLRQRMGEDFLEFMDTWWRDRINLAVNKAWAMEEYFKIAPRDKNFVRANVFKNKIIAYCEYKGLKYNPDIEERLRNNGKEYVVVADNNFLRNEMKYVDNYQY